MWLFMAYENSIQSDVVNPLVLSPLSLLPDSNLAPVMQAVCERSSCNSTIHLSITFTAPAEEYGELVLDALTAAVNRDKCALDSKHDVCAAVQEACTAAGVHSSCTIQSAHARDRQGTSNTLWILLWEAVAVFGIIAVVIVVAIAIFTGLQTYVWELSNQDDTQASRARSAAVPGLRGILVPPKVNWGTTLAAAALLRKPLLVVEDHDPDYADSARSRQPAEIDKCSSVMEGNATHGSSGSSGSCTVCFERACSFVLVPCGHLAMCERCVYTWFFVEQKAGCPICRTPVRHTQKVFAV